MGLFNFVKEAGEKLWDNLTDHKGQSDKVSEHLKKLNIPKLKVVYSEEPPLTPIDDQDISCRFHCICPNKDMRKCTERRTIPASNAWVPAAAGLIIGGEVVKDMVNRAGTMRLHCEDK